MNRSPGSLLVVALVFSALGIACFAAGCGLPTGDLPGVPHLPGLRAAWSTNADRTMAYCWEREPDTMPIEEYPGGYFCQSGCVLYRDQPVALYLWIRVEPGAQRFADQSTWCVETAECGEQVEHEPCPNSPSPVVE